MRITKKIVLKTIVLTLCVVFILAVSAFGIVSLLAPQTMMDFTASIGLDSISGDYAYQEYERTGDVACLARSFIVSADMKNDRTAEDRFTRLYEHEEFSEFCAEQDSAISKEEGRSGYTYRGYVCGLAARVKYRLASADTEEEVIDFALSETGKSFPQGNPLVALTVEAAKAQDTEFCGLLITRIRGGGFEESADYKNMIKILEDVIHA